MDNEFNTFDQGVEPGGLRNSTQIRILITYLIGSMNPPVGTSLITEALQTHGLANYFEITDSIGELIENGLISDNDGLLSLTEKGKISFRELADELPLSVKETALADAVNLQILEKNEKENFVEIVKCDKGYNVIFKMLHGGSSLMDLSLYAADIEQAERLKHNFLKDPSKVFKSVVSVLYI